MRNRTFCIACIAVAVLGGLFGRFVPTVSAAEKNPNQVLSLGDINHPDKAALEQFAERLKAAGEHNAAMLRRLSDPIRRAEFMFQGGKRDSLRAIVVKVYEDTMSEMWGPMSIWEARALEASDPAVEVYVEGTDEYDDTMFAYWDENRDPPSLGQPLTMPSPSSPPFSLPGGFVGAVVLAPEFSKPH